MNIRSTTAAQAYIATRPATAPTPKEHTTDFSSGFEKLAENFVSTLKEGEATAKAALTGNADPHALVQALAQTELAVETAVTLRDKVVEAYQEILRMPV